MPGLRPHLGACRRVALPEVASGIHLALPEVQAPRASHAPPRCTSGMGNAIIRY